jgi:hypothetical protein
MTIKKETKDQQKYFKFQYLAFLNFILTEAKFVNNWRAFCETSF